MISNFSYAGSFAVDLGDLRLQIMKGKAKMKAPSMIHKGEDGRCFNNSCGVVLMDGDRKGILIKSGRRTEADVTALCENCLSLMTTEPNDWDDEEGEW